MGTDTIEVHILLANGYYDWIVVDESFFDFFIEYVTPGTTVVTLQYKNYFCFASLYMMQMCI